MKIAAISDTHGYLPTPPECDVLIHAGDWTPATNHSREFQKNWVTDHFYPWIQRAEDVAKHIIYIAGNHDFVARSDPKMMFNISGVHYLMNESVEIGGIRFWGSPYSNKFGDWAFMRDEDGLDEIWQTIPDDTNVLITHGPPYGIGDRCDHYDNDPHQGSKGLMNKALSLPDLKLMLFGHIHEAAGVYDYVEREFGFKAANCSHVNLQYKPRQGYLEFEL